MSYGGLCDQINFRKFGNLIRSSLTAECPTEQPAHPPIRKVLAFGDFHYLFFIARLQAWRAERDTVLPFLSVCPSVQCWYCV